MRVSKALLSLVPNAKFGIEDNDYDKIQWLDERPLPSKSDVMNEVNRLVNEWNNIEYRRLRAPEYPSLADFADAYYWTQKGDNTKMNEYVAKCDAVKEKYPKGE